MNVDMYDFYKKCEEDALNKKGTTDFDRQLNYIVNMCLFVKQNRNFYFGIFPDANEELIAIIKQKYPTYIFFDNFGDTFAG